MQLRVLALDFDGTITRGDAVHPEVRAAIGEARALGFRVVLVTGRRIAHLRETAGDLSFVDGVVAENGAVLTFPQTGDSAVLASRPPDAFVAELVRQGVEHECGDVVIEMEASEAWKALSIIRDQQLPLVLLFNRNRVMILPQGISKATGLRQLLDTMRLSVHNTVSVGDAENDHAMLEATELGAAVRWGSPALIAAADDVVEGEDASGVAAYIRTLCRYERIPEVLLNRRRLLLGSRVDTGEPVHLAIKGRNVLIVGDPRSGKSWVAGLLAEQLIFQQYSICVIDPEGDYEGLAALPDVIAFGGDDAPPRARELARALGHADVSVLVNLSRMPLEAKREYVRELLQILMVLRRENGLPHRIFLDEAHYFIGNGATSSMVDLELAGYTLVSYRASGIDSVLLGAAETVIVSRASDPVEVRQLIEAHDLKGSVDEWLELLGELPTDEAVIFPGIAETGSSPLRVRLATRRTYHVRHLQKYIDVPIADYHAFVFTRDGHPAGMRAKTIGELAEIVGSVEEAAIHGHLRRNDISRWIGDVYGDHQLAATIRETEELHCLQRLPDVNGAITAAIRERYATASDRDSGRRSQ